MIKDINRVYKLNPLYLKNSLAKKILRGVEPFYDDNIIPVDKKVILSFNFLDVLHRELTDDDNENICNNIILALINFIIS